MFCRNCGSLIEDESVRFCSECGAEIVAPAKNDENDTISDTSVTETEVVTKEADVIQEAVPEQNEVEINNATEAEYVEDADEAANDADVQSADIAALNSTEQVKVVEKTDKKVQKGGKPLFVFLGTIFAILTIAFSAVGFVNEIKNNVVDIFLVINHCVLIALSLLIIIYGAAKSKALSRVKGLFILGLLAFNVIIYKDLFLNYFDDFKACSNSLEKYQTILLVAGMGLFFLFLLLDAVKSLFAADVMNPVGGFVGYFSAVAILAYVSIDIYNLTKIDLYAIVSLPYAQFAMFTFATILSGSARRRK